MVHFLEQGGHRVRTAVNGNQALQLILQECSDVLVADYALLGLDGLELCRRVRHLYRRGILPHYTSIILLANELQNFAESLEAGADDLIIRRAESLTELQSKIQSRIAAAIRLRTAEINYTNIAQYDKLTHLLNRHTFLERGKEIWERSLSSHYPLSVVMFGCDNFKRINRKFGIRCGDAVLEESAEIIRDSSRTTDVFCRFGGDEFCALLSGCNEAKAIEWAERVRVRFAEQPFLAALDVGTKVDVNLTFSFGIAERSEQTRKLEQLITRADTAMDNAKRAGRNRCAAYVESSEMPEP
jgi:diguanylate cyclase (GGDEF)-like protein